MLVSHKSKVSCCFIHLKPGVRNNLRHSNFRLQCETIKVLLERFSLKAALPSRRRLRPSAFPPTSQDSGRPQNALRCQRLVRACMNCMPSGCAFWLWWTSVLRKTLKSWADTKAPVHSLQSEVEPDVLQHQAFLGFGLRRRWFFCASSWVFAPSTLTSEQPPSYVWVAVVAFLPTSHTHPVLLLPLPRRTPWKCQT